jgi:hypothetical protein
MASEPGSGVANAVVVEENVTTVLGLPVPPAAPWVVNVIRPGVGSKPVRVAVPLPVTVRVLLLALKLKTSDVSDSVEVRPLCTAVYSRPVCPLVRGVVNVTHAKHAPNPAKLPLSAPMSPGFTKVIVVGVKVSVPISDSVLPATIGTACAE